MSLNIWNNFCNKKNIKKRVLNILPKHLVNMLPEKKIDY
jgi:hypothetical protein